MTTKIANAGRASGPCRKMMVNIELEVYESLRDEAFESRKSMSRVVNDALKKHIGKRKPAKPGEPGPEIGAKPAHLGKTTGNDSRVSG